jgi:hypothetical protein
MDVPVTGSSHLPAGCKCRLQHPSTHLHYVYRRFNFDIDGATNNLTLAHDASIALHGLAWTPLRSETWQVPISANARIVLNKQANPGYLMEVGPTTNHVTLFEAADMYVVGYHPTET